MDFKKHNNNKISCHITESEITGMGYTLEEIMMNGPRTKEFMDHIFAMTQEECKVDFSLEIRTVKAELRPDHSLELVFSQHSVDEVADTEALMNNLLEAVRNELQARGKGKQEANPKSVMPEQEKQEDLPEGVQIVVMLVFDNMDQVIRFAGQLPKDLIPENSLYRYQKKYYIRMDLTAFSKKQVERLSMITDEYVEEIQAGTARSAYIAEHGELLIGGDAIGRLRDL